MSVELRSIAFSRASIAGGAVNIRRNAREPVAIAEITAGQPVSQVAAACYTLDQLAGGTVPIQVRLGRRMPESDRVEVRALAQPSVPLAPWLASSIAPALAWPSVLTWAYWAWIYWVVGQTHAVTPPGPVGGVEADDVTFQGNIAVVTFNADVSALRPRGVGVYPVRWRWQFRRSASDPWTDFASTRHQIYVIVSEPTLPWRQVPDDPANTQLPWIQVLDVACRWAAGASTQDQAAARVTQEVYALGERGVVAYDCAGPGVFNLGMPAYTLLPGVFDCTRFLERVRGGLGNGAFVNCSDCASVVATFANILGCDLSQSRMFGPVPFPLNPTRGIGTHTWLSACAVGAFAMHEVAWTGACGEDDVVYDACLAVDGDVDPTRAPHTVRLPVAMRFGEAPQGSYRDRLVAPAGRLVCQPQPLTRQRRFVV